MIKFFPIVCSLFFLAACAGGGQEDFSMSIKYFSGDGVEQSDVKGMEFLVKAAKAGNADAELTLGFFHAKGEHGLAQDSEKATELFLRAAKHGNSDAQYNMGLAYVRADGVEQDYNQALRWFTEAAKQDDAGAQYNLGVMHLSGDGTVKNPLMAYAWFKLASENGYVGASEGMQDARHEMTEEQAREIDATVAKVKATVRKSVQPQMNVNTNAVPL